MLCALQQVVQVRRGGMPSTAPLESKRSTSSEIQSTSSSSQESNVALVVSCLMETMAGSVHSWPGELTVVVHSVGLEEDQENEINLLREQVRETKRVETNKRFRVQL